MTLPTELPKWYQVEEDQEKGWTPKTSDIIISNNPANREIREAWYAQNNTTYTPTAEYQKELNRLNVSNYASLKSKGGYTTILRDNLVAMAETLMLENPSFRRMYYGVFAGQLEG